MALRLDDLVICGEICNTTNYSTHGWLRLCGQEQTLSLQLTGNCSPDLLGKRLRFEARDADDREAIGETGDVDLGGLAWQQVGPTGEMTAERRVEGGDRPPGERSQLGEPAPLEWKPCLYLEWHSQNGRMVVELVDPILEFVGDEEDDLPGEGRRGVAETPPDLEYGLDDDVGPPALEADSAEADFEREGDLDPDGVSGPLAEESEFDPQHDDDPYGLFPDELQQHFDQEASQLDRSLEGDDPAAKSIREMELMDELIEGGEGDIIASIFEEPMKLPRPEQLDDVQVEAALKSLLGQLAKFGIALSVCEHFTPRDAYRLLLDDICTEERAYPELKNTQWVQHFMTSEFCETCEAEMEREFEEYERRRKEKPDDDPSGDEDVPY